MHIIKITANIVAQVPVIYRIILNTVCRDTHSQTLSVKMVQGCSITRVRAFLKIFDIQYCSWGDFHLYISSRLTRKALDIFILEI